MAPWLALTLLLAVLGSVVGGRPQRGPRALHALQALQAAPAEGLEQILGKPTEAPVDLTRSLLSRRLVDGVVGVNVRARWRVAGDGQPEDIGYGYQRSRNPALPARSARGSSRGSARGSDSASGRQEVQGLLLLGEPRAWRDAADAGTNGRGVGKG